MKVRTRHFAHVGDMPDEKMPRIIKQRDNAINVYRVRSLTARESAQSVPGTTLASSCLLHWVEMGMTKPSHIEWSSAASTHNAALKSSDVRSLRQMTPNASHAC